jgi:hypothetical protein
MRNTKKKMKASAGEVENTPPAMVDTKETATPNKSVSSTNLFVGECDALKGHIYDYSEHMNADQYNKTTKIISVYVGSTYKMGGNIRRGIELGTLNVLRKLQPLPADPTEDDRVMHQERLILYVRRQDTLLYNNGLLYSLIWGQCSNALRQKLNALPNIPLLSDDDDGIGLLKAIHDQYGIDSCGSSNNLAGTYPCRSGDLGTTNSSGGGGAQVDQGGKPMGGSSGCGGDPSQQQQRKQRPYNIQYDAIPNGTAVSLKGLISQPDRNGDRGEIIDYDPTSKRYTVRLEDTDDEKLRVKPENLLQHAHVKLHNIESQPSLNGLQGTINAWDGRKERYNIYVMDTSNVLSLKPTNVILQEGTVAKIVGLTGKPELKQQFGTIKSWIADSNRYDVQLSQSQVVRIKVDNVRV